MSVSNSSSMYNNKYYYNTGKCHDNSTGSFLSGRCKKFNKITMMECPCQAHLTRLYFSIMWKMVAMDGFSITPHTQQRKYGMFIVLILSYPVKFYESHAVSGLVMSPMQYAGLLWVPCSMQACYESHAVSGLVNLSLAVSRLVDLLLAVSGLVDLSLAVSGLVDLSLGQASVHLFI